MFGKCKVRKNWQFSLDERNSNFVRIYPYHFRSSHRRCSVRKGVLRNFARFTEKHLYQSLFFNKVAKVNKVIKKETLAQVFSCEFCEISKKTFFTEHLRTTASTTSS